MGTVLFTRMSALVLGMATVGCASWAVRPDLREVQRFAVLYAAAEAAALRDFDLVILDPDTASPKTVHTLRRQGVVVLGYLNLGEVEAYRWYAARVDPSWLRGRNPAWAGHRLVDTREPGWHRLVVETVIPAILAKGYQGLYLDMVDAPTYPGMEDTAPGMADLVRTIRKRYPRLVLVAGNPQALLGRIGRYLDGMCVESLATVPDGRGGFTAVPDAVLKERMRRLKTLQTAYRLPVFVVNYTAPDDRRLQAWATRVTARAGFVPFVAVPDLDRLLPQPDPNGRTP